MQRWRSAVLWGCVVIAAAATIVLIRENLGSRTGPAQQGRVLDKILSVRSQNQKSVILPPVGAEASVVIAQLRRSALDGSPQAACRIAQEIRRCSSIAASLELAETFASLPPEATKALPISAADIVTSADKTAASCRNILRGKELDGYRFQRIAADSGDRQFQRWLVASPSLDENDFLSRLDDWKDYRARSERYVAEALRSRRGDDLKLLLTIYAPSHYRKPRPPFKIDDPATFVALLAVARSNDVELNEPQLVKMGEEIAANASREEALEINKRLNDLGTNWTFGKESATEGISSESLEGSFCQR